jgi:hypothetical protein
VGAAVDAPLFVGRTGLPLRPHGLEEAWRSAREEVGLPQGRLEEVKKTRDMLSAAVVSGGSPLASEVSVSRIGAVPWNLMLPRFAPTYPKGSVRESEILCIGSRGHPGRPLGGRPLQLWTLVGAPGAAVKGPLRRPFGRP